jgi:hypothetical protein
MDYACIQLLLAFSNVGICYDMSAWSPFMCQINSMLSQKRIEVNSIVIVHMKSMNGGQEMTRNKENYVADDAIMCSIEHQHSAHFFLFSINFFCNVPCYSKIKNLFV